jgi:hypothetical protein
VVFLYPKKMEFAAAARAIKIRGQMQFGQNPLEGKFDYKAFFADIPFFDEKTYGTYAMLVRDFYASDIQEKFNALFPGLDCAKIPASIHNPNAYMEAHRPVVERLIAQYKNTTSPLEFYGSKHMAEGIALLMDCLTHKEMKGGILADEQGMAKGHPETTKVLTPTGWAMMKDLRVGDPIIGSSGEATKVTGVFPRGELDVFRATFHDGASVLVDGEHLWAVRDANGNNRKKPFQVQDTAYLRKNITTNGGESKWRIPVVGPVQFKPKNRLPIDPYTIGVLIGDGSLVRCVEFSSADAYISDRVGRSIPEGYKLNAHPDLRGSKTVIYRIVANTRTSKKNKIITAIKDLGLIGKHSYEKSIPEIYKFSSVDDRIALLQGLMDTDGHAGKNGHTSFCTTSEGLANDFVFLIQSLGGIATFFRKKTSLKGVRMRDSFLISMALPQGINPFGLPRKANQFKPRTEYKPNRILKSITPEGRARVICISVAAENHLYVTEHCIVTHNTIQTIIAMKEAGMKRVLVIAPKTARATAWPNELRLVDKKTTFAFGRPAAPGSRNVDFELFTWDDLRRMPNMGEIFDLEDALREQGKLTDKSMLRLTELRETVKVWASKFDCVVADEAHRAKHAGSQRSTALRNLCEFVPRVLLLTGTPITKRPKDVLHGLQIIKHPLAKEPKKFMARYNPENPGGWGKAKPVSKQRLEELHVLLRDCYIRREKNQTNLPPKIRYVQKVELTDKELEDIEKRWEAYCDEVVEVGGHRIKRRVQMEKPSYPVDLVHTMKVREWVSLNKVEALSEWADDLLDADEKVVIFTQFTETFDAYMKKYKGIAVGINGTVSTENRVKAVDSFQKDPKVKVFIGNIQAAGEGITITAACHLGFNDLAWLPTEMLQAEDRICRGGQLRPCGIYFFLANHEVDEDGFKDFIKSKGVVQTVTNRRDEKGEISDAEWKGETEGTAVQELGVAQQQLGGDFDWEDAGEEPPDQIQTHEPTGRDFVERTIQRNLMNQAKTRGDLFGGDGRQDRQQALTVLKTSLPEGYAGDNIILDELSKLQTVLIGWNLEFAKSVIGWIRLRRKLSPKQRSKAMEIIAKNRRYLLGRNNVQ